MKYVNLYIISTLIWSILLVLFLYLKNKRLELIVKQSNLKDTFLFMPNIKLNNEPIVIILSLLFAPIMLILALIVGLFRLLKLT